MTLADLAAVAFTGSYLDLQDVPAVLGQLGVNGAGELTFNGQPVMNSAGEWVGALPGFKDHRESRVRTVQPVSLGRTDRMEFRWFLPR